jgi:hypothetical protein
MGMGMGTGLHPEGTASNNSHEPVRTNMVYNSKSIIKYLMSIMYN